jgi:polyisoprenoid-binding protein YceI
MKKLALSLAFVAFASSAYAAPETFVIDATHTTPRFEYKHFGYFNQIHSFDKTSGQLIYDPVAHTGSVDITIDAKSVNTGFDLLNQHIQDADFFDTAKYPTITYKSTVVKFRDNKPYEVEGNLTIKGITKPVTLKLTSFQMMMNPMFKKMEVGANAVAHIKRSEFNMSKYAPMVSDDVTLSIAMEAIKQ